jgi:hypothetical protein
MAFDLRDEGSQLVLRIEAPEDAQPVLEQLATSFTQDAAVANRT